MSTCLYKIAQKVIPVGYRTRKCASLYVPVGYSYKNGAGVARLSNDNFWGSMRVLAHQNHPVLKCSTRACSRISTSKSYAHLPGNHAHLPGKSGNHAHLPGNHAHLPGKSGTPRNSCLCMVLRAGDHAHPGWQMTRTGQFWACMQRILPL
eukprot:scaffold10980_cov19-Tisochrysis_lutea.AAC.1